MSRRALRPLVALLAALFAWVAFEGIAALWTGNSFLARRLDPLGRQGAGLAEVDRDAGAAVTPGPWALDVDPVVGFRCKAEHVQTIHGVPAATDAFGQRVHIGPPPEPGALRIVLLGDSVAFGFGVADDETYAARLEDSLAALAPAGSPRPFVQTVACPGWNQVQAFRYLANHLARLAPDVVLYLPVSNDLDDAYWINELGWREFQLDPRLGSERPALNVDGYESMVRGFSGKAALADLVAVANAGGLRAVPQAHLSGVTPESRHRWDAFVERTLALDERLRARGIAFGVVLFSDKDFEREVERRLRDARPELPLAGLLAGFAKSDQLQADPHPNAACVRAGARWMARFLIEAGWFEADPEHDLPGDEPAYAGRHMRLLETEEREALGIERRALVARFLGPEVVVSEARGVHQIYAGMAGDGTVGRHVYVALAANGAKRLSLELERLEAGASLWPLELGVEVGGRAIGSLCVPAPDGNADERIVALSLPLPEDAVAEPYLDVLVRSSSWIEERLPKPRLAAYRLRRIALVP